MNGVLIIGAGGHAKVVADILQLQGIEIAGFLDDNPALWNSLVLGLPVLGAIDSYAQFPSVGLVMAIGSNPLRKQIVERFGQPAAELWINAIHPHATLARSVQLGRGVVIAARAVITPDTCIGDHVIINTSATVDHDCRIGDYTHVAPGVHLAGNTTIGSGVLMGVGSQTIPGCSIGDWAIVGAGASVTKSVAAGLTVVGVPAKPLYKG